MALTNSRWLTFSNIFCLLSLILCMIPGYLLVRYGINFGDEPYQIMNSMDVNRSPLAPLSSWLGGVVGGLTDFRWTAFRYLAVTLNYLAIFTGGIYLYRRARSFKIAAAAMSAALLLSGFSRGYHNIAGWDCWTTFFTVLLIVCVLELLHKPAYGRVIVTGAVAAVTVAVRVPNALVVVPGVWLILLIRASRRHGRDNKMPKSYPWLYLLSGGIFLLLIICALYGSPGFYLSTLQANLLSAHDASGFPLLMLYDTVRYVFSMMGFAMVVCILDKIKDNEPGIENPKLQKAAVAVASACAVGFLFLMMVFNSMVVSVTWYDVQWIMLALCFAIWHYFKKKDTGGLIDSLAVLIIGCACFAGSNNGFLKYPGYVLIPLTTALLLPLCGLRRMKYYMLIAGMPLVVMAFWRIPRTSFGDYGIIGADTRIEHGRARGIYTSAERAARVEAVEEYKAGADPEEERIVVGEGYDRFMYEYLLDCPDSYMRHDWGGLHNLDSPEFIEWVRKQTCGAGDPVIIYVQREGGASTKMKEYLDSNMRPSIHDGFIIYVR